MFGLTDELDLLVLFIVFQQFILFKFPKFKLLQMALVIWSFQPILYYSYVGSISVLEIFIILFSDITVVISVMGGKRK